MVKRRERSSRRALSLLTVFLLAGLGACSNEDDSGTSAPAAAPTADAPAAQPLPDATSPASAPSAGESPPAEPAADADTVGDEQDMAADDAADQGEGALTADENGIPDLQPLPPGTAPRDIGVVLYPDARKIEESSFITRKAAS